MENESLIIKPKKPKGEDGYKVFSIRIREDLAGRLDAVSAQSGRSRNELIGIFLAYALDRCHIEDGETD